MLYRRFGRTGLAVPVFSLGLMRLMQGWQDTGLEPIDPAGQATLDQVVETALAHGINHLETARAYGSCERQLGLVLRRLKRADYILQTKVQPTNHPAEFETAVRDSLQRLGVERIDLLAIHGVNDYRSLWQTCRPGGCLAVARRLQKEGRVGWVGFSGHADTDVLQAAIRHQEDGGFDYLNIHFYYIFQQHRAVIEEAAARDMGVFVISPTDKGGRLQEPPAKLLELCQPLSPMLFNDWFCLSQPGVSTISLGASAPFHFDEHLKVLPLLAAGGQDLLAETDERLRRAMAAATGQERPDWLWPSLPCWEDTPGGINMRLVLWLANLVRGWDLADYARDRYLGLGRDFPWIPGNDAARLGQYEFGRCLRRTDLDEGSLREMLEKAHELLARG